MKIKEILLIVETIERASNAYFYSFRCNLKEYFVFLEEREFYEDTIIQEDERGNKKIRSERKTELQYRLFCYSDFRFIEPIELLTNFWVNDNGIELTGTKDIQMHVIDILEVTTFNRALGQYLHLKSLKNVGDIEQYVNVPFAKRLLNLTVLSERFFITKEGLSIFTYPQGQHYFKGAIPSGMLFFNHLNCGYVGNPILRINRKGRPNTDEGLKKILGEDFRETLHLMFSPFTLIDLYDSGLSYFKNNFLVIADVRKKALYLQENVKIHLKPTQHELSNYIELVYNQLQLQTMTMHNSFPAHLYQDDDNQFKVRLYVENYAKEHNRFIERLNLFSNLLSVYARDEHANPPAISHFNLLLIRKEVELISNYDYEEHTLDLVEFSFRCTAANCLSFIHEYLFKKINSLKAITTIHYNVGFPLMLEETLEEFLGIEGITYDDIVEGWDQIPAPTNGIVYASEEDAIEAMLEREAQEEE